MAHFYGALNAGRGSSTRTGEKNGGLRAIAAGWGGAVQAHVWYNTEAGEDWVSVSLGERQGCGQSPEKVLYHGPLNRYDPEGKSEMAEITCHAQTGQ